MNLSTGKLSDVLPVIQAEIFKICTRLLSEIVCFCVRMGDTGSRACWIREVL